MMLILLVVRDEGKDAPGHWLDDTWYHHEIVTSCPGTSLPRLLERFVAGLEIYGGGLVVLMTSFLLST
jgi:hypothetical protein